MDKKDLKFNQSIQDPLIEAAKTIDLATKALPENERIEKAKDLFDTYLATGKIDKTE